MQSSVISKQIYIIHNCYNFLYPIILFVLTACGNNGFRSFALARLSLILSSLFHWNTFRLPLAQQGGDHCLSLFGGCPTLAWPRQSVPSTRFNRGNKKIIPFLLRPFHTLLAWPIPGRCYFLKPTIDFQPFSLTSQKSPALDLWLWENIFTSLLLHSPKTIEFKPLCQRGKNRSKLEAVAQSRPAAVCAC